MFLSGNSARIVDSVAWKWAILHFVKNGLSYVLAISKVQCPPFLAAMTPNFAGQLNLGDIPDATSVNPAVFEAIAYGLLAAES
jgi:hypothetical protein